MWLESSGRLQRFCTLYGWGGWITPSYNDIWKQSVVGFQKVGTSGLVWHAIWCLVSTTFTTYLAMRSIHPSALQKLHQAPLGHMHIKFKWTACFTENNSKRVAIGLSDLYLIVVVLLSIQAQHWSVQSSTVSYLRFIRALILRKVRWFSFLVAACFLVWNSLDVTCEARLSVSYSCRCLQIVRNFFCTSLICDRHASMSSNIRLYVMLIPFEGLCHEWNYCALLLS